MARRARALGVTIADRTAVRAVQRNADGAVVRTERGDVGARLVIAADGLHSSQRHAAHLQAAPSTHHRFAVRRHFGVRPWSEDVEVYVDDLGEAVVTPVGGDTINVNLVWEADDEGGPASFDGLEQRFPVLHARLRGAPVLSTLRGAGPMERRAIRRTCERMLLIGDAGGFIDSIAADGLSMAFNAALVLREILPEILASDADVESLARYEREARRLFRSYRVVTGSLLWIARRPRVRRALIGFLGRHEAVGDAMMSGAMRLMLANVRA
jgi:flavin-dependent dehydrogenase